MTPPPPEGARDWTVTEVAQALGVNRATVYRWIRTGLLPAQQQGTRWHVEGRWIPRLQRWRTWTTAAADPQQRVMALRVRPALFAAIETLAQRGGISWATAATWVLLRGLPDAPPDAWPVLIRNEAVRETVAQVSRAWQVSPDAAAAWLIERGVATLQGPPNVDKPPEIQ